MFVHVPVSRVPSGAGAMVPSDSGSHSVFTTPLLGPLVTKQTAKTGAQQRSATFRLGGRRSTGLPRERGETDDPIDPPLPNFEHESQVP